MLCIRVLASWLVLAVLAPVVNSELKCTCPSGPYSQTLTANLGVGEYSVHFVATEGPHKGRATIGTLVLRETRSSDRSPVTGETAQDHDISETPFYGWTDADFGLVGAPICEEGPHPAPDSQDPVYPGVLVHYFDWRASTFPKQPEHAPTLLVGTLSNLRNGDMWLDGCGIAMWVQKQTDDTLRGRWREWGIVQGSRGCFCISAK